MSQAPSTSDKPMLYFALFPFISKLVIIPRLARYRAALGAEARRGRELCPAALKQRLLPGGVRSRADPGGWILLTTLAVEPSFPFCSPGPRSL